MSGPVDDRGETLLEVLIAVVIMGIAIVAIIGGLVTSVLMSDVHRKQATAGATVRDYAETLENYVAAGNYVACATTYPFVTGFTTPAGFDKPKVVTGSMRYWNTTTNSWQTSCPSQDAGLQQLTVQESSSDGRASEQVVIVLRKPCGLGMTIC